MLKTQVFQVVRRLGYELRKEMSGFTPEEIALVGAVRGYTATGSRRIVGLVDAVKYVVANRIEGAIVECGVWRGGSMMAVARTLLALGDTSRDLYLFDTFEGMPPPGTKDRQSNGLPAKDLLAGVERSEDVANTWCVAGLQAVMKNLKSTGYPSERLHFVQGKVEDTVPAKAPDGIALLRLDTDWYESTLHELVHLYPRLVADGVLILDDYGDWLGAKDATDEFFAKQPFRPLLTRMDETGRMIVKPRI